MSIAFPLIRQLIEALEVEPNSPQRTPANEAGIGQSHQRLPETSQEIPTKAIEARIHISTLSQWFREYYSGAVLVRTIQHEIHLPHAPF